MLKSNNLTKTFFFNFKSVLNLRISSKYIIGSSILFSSLYYLFSKSRVRLVAKIEKPKGAMDEWFKMNVLSIEAG